MSVNQERSILLVEDEAIIALTEATALRGFGYSVRVVHSGEEAVRVALGNARVDLILMDIDLGRGISGPDAAARILAERNVPIVFLTSHQEEDMVAKVRGITRYGYVIKDSGDFVLRSSIEMAIELFHAHQCLTTELAERTRVQTELSTSQQITEDIINAIPARVFWKSRDLVYLGCNTVFARDAGFTSPGEIIGKDDFAMGWRDQAELYRADDRHVIESGQPKLLIEEPQTTPEGATMTLLTSKIPLRRGDGEVIGILGIYLDITARKRAEEEVQMLSHLTDDHPDPVMRIGEDGTIFYANRASDPVLAAWKCTRAQRIPLEWQEVVTAAVQRRASTRREMLSDERQYSLLVIPVKHCSWVSVYGRDITENKRSREVIERRILALTQPGEQGDVTFEDLFDREEIQRIQDEFSDATGVASIITHVDGTPLTAPSNFTSLCSDIIRKTERGCVNCFRSDAAIGRYHPAGPVVQQCLSGGLWDAGASITVGNRHIANWLIGQVRDETQSDEVMCAYAREIGADEDLFIEAFRQVPAMTRAQFERIATMLFSMAGQLSRAAYQNIQQARLITEQERAQDRITHLLQEKELLLKEVHHRIKNNMNTVMSLLSLQARSMNDPALAGALGDARRRIQSMMLLYEKLYRSEGFRDLPVAAYLQALIRDILAGFPNKDVVQLEVDIQDFPMETRQLSAVGLIVNELLTNAMKYAFAGREGGMIRIAATVQGKRARVEVRDDGVGIPPGFELQSSPGFGLKLVDMLTQQIEGTLRIEQNGGTAFILECDAG